MSREQAMRIPLGTHPSPSRRTLDERLVVRFPSLARRVFAAALRLPLRSRLRRRILARAVRRGYAATSRGDYALSLTAYAPDVEMHVRESTAVADDLVGVHRGHDGWRV